MGLLSASVSAMEAGPFKFEAISPAAASAWPGNFTSSASGTRCPSGARCVSLSSSGDLMLRMGPPVTRVPSGSRTPGLRTSSDTPGLGKAAEALPETGPVIRRGLVVGAVVLALPVTLAKLGGLPPAALSVAAFTLPDAGAPDAL